MTWLNWLKWENSQSQRIGQATWLRTPRSTLVLRAFAKWLRSLVPNQISDCYISKNIYGNLFLILSKRFLRVHLLSFKVGYFDHF